MTNRYYVLRKIIHLKTLYPYNTWKFCGEQTHDRILAYAVELTGAANGTVQGNLYELDYQ